VASGPLTLTGKVTHIFSWTEFKTLTQVLCRAVVTIPTMKRLPLAAPPTCRPNQQEHRARLPRHRSQTLCVTSRPPPQLKFTSIVLRLAQRSHTILCYIVLTCRMRTAIGRSQGQHEELG
jgi:hypothetical protein